MKFKYSSKLNNLFFVFVNFTNILVGCDLYKLEDLNDGDIKVKVVSEKLLPSVLSCVHYCKIKDGSKRCVPWFKDGVCKCVFHSEVSDNTIPARYSLKKLPTFCSTPFGTFESVQTNQICYCHPVNSGESNCKDSYTLIKESVCYEGKDDMYGEFIFPHAGKVTSIKLEHISGLITCDKDNPKFGSGIWACSTDETQLSTVITDVDKNIVFPPGVTMHPVVMEVIFSDKDAFRMTNTALLFTKPTINVYTGERLHIWNTNDYGDKYDGDNAGRHCVKVYAKYE